MPAQGEVMSNRNILAIAVILLGIFWNQVSSFALTILDDIVVVDVDKPDDEFVNATKDLAALVTDTEDRIKLSLFNKEFSDRIVSYSSTVQQANDVYVLAAKIFFENTLVGKYDGLAEGLRTLIRSTTTDDNHVLSEEEKQELSNKFLGLSWNLSR
jgi:hypothetical protein